MESGKFWSLFAETGEPLYWLLCRAQERLPEERPGSNKGEMQGPLLPPKL